MKKISVFGNFLINDERRFERLKKSFLSFYKADIDSWVVNIRGSYKYQVKDFLIKKINSNLNISFKDSSNGWFYDTHELLKYLNTEYIFLWNEDHINLKNEIFFNRIVDEVIENDLDHLIYSLHYGGHSVESFSLNESIKSENLIFINCDKKIHLKRINLINQKNLMGHSYIISLISIIKKNLFEKIINSNDPLIKRWPKNTPFDFEKSDLDVHWLPLKIGTTTEEFFKCMDKDWDFNTKKLIKNDNVIYKKNFYSELLIKIIKPIIKPAIIIIRETVNKIYSNLFFK